MNLLRQIIRKMILTESLATNPSHYRKLVKLIIDKDQMPMDSISSRLNIKTLGHHNINQIRIHLLENGMKMVASMK